jgi:hypothetical protein
VPQVSGTSSPGDVASEGSRWRTWGWKLLEPGDQPAYHISSARLEQRRTARTGGWWSVRSLVWAVPALGDPLRAPRRHPPRSHHPRCRRHQMRFVQRGSWMLLVADMGGRASATRADAADAGLALRGSDQRSCSIARSALPALRRWTEMPTRGSVPSSEPRNDSMTATTFVVGSRDDRLGRMTFALSGLVSKALAAGLSLASPFCCWGACSSRVCGAARARQLRAAQVGTTDERTPIPESAGVATVLRQSASGTDAARHDAA